MIDPGPLQGAGSSLALVVALVVVCVLLAAALGYMGFTLWEIGQSTPLTGWFQP